MEDDLDIEPHPPGFVQQIAERCVLSRGPIDLSPEPWLIESEEDAERLVEILVDQSHEVFSRSSEWGAFSLTQGQGTGLTRAEAIWRRTA